MIVFCLFTVTDEQALALRVEKRGFCQQLDQGRNSSVLPSSLLFFASLSLSAKGITRYIFFPAPPASWLDVQTQLRRTLMFAEMLEKTVSRMMYGSSLFSGNLTDEDWLVCRGLNFQKGKPG